MQVKFSEAFQRVDERIALNCACGPAGAGAGLPIRSIPGRAEMIADDPIETPKAAL
jgi:hypothetical protein